MKTAELSTLINAYLKEIQKLNEKYGLVIDVPVGYIRELGSLSKIPLATIYGDVYSRSDWEEYLVMPRRLPLSIKTE